MRRALCFAGLLFAWLCAQGALMQSVQVFAWGRMFAGYARTMSWQAALEQTLDPGKPCRLCCAVRKVKEETRAPAAPLAPREASRLDLGLAIAEAVEPPVYSTYDYTTGDRCLVEWRAPVPTPPPRAVMA